MSVGNTVIAIIALLVIVLVVGCIGFNAADRALPVTSEDDPVAPDGEREVVPASRAVVRVETRQPDGKPATLQ